MAQPMTFEVIVTKMDRRSKDITSSYSVNWKSQGSHILEGLRNLVEQNEILLTDVTLACDGEYIQAHKLVLSLCSSFFKDLFQKHRADKSNTIVILGDVSARNLRYLLRFMYQGKVNIPSKHVDSFLKAGNMLKVEGLITSGPDVDSGINEEKGETHQANEDEIPEDEVEPATSPSSGQGQILAPVCRKFRKSNLNISPKRKIRRIIVNGQEVKGGRKLNDAQLGEPVIKSEPTHTTFRNEEGQDWIPGEEEESIAPISTPTPDPLSSNSRVDIRVEQKIMRAPFSQKPRRSKIYEYFHYDPFKMTYQCNSCSTSLKQTIGTGSLVNHLKKHKLSYIEFLKRKHKEPSKFI